ncbi:RNA polymerase factor sigma-54 [Aquabacterium sp.]|uniref:RNA polymerase factor sigma-54 n=1 Tax=Aquabacterium sp. TaxID=1872578 RepID=UPI00378504F3
MRPMMDLHAEHRQQQRFSPRLQHAVRLLQLSSQDFAQVLTQALERNPFLALDQGLDGSADPLPDDGAVEDVDAPRDADPDPWLQGASVGPADAGDDVPAGERFAAEHSLAAHLHAQLAGQAMAERERWLARVIVEALDDDGYLRCGLDELLPLIELSPRPTLAEMRQALRQVQALEPAGVGARDVAECLRLQLPLIEDADLRQLARRIVDDHLPQLAARELPAIAQALSRPLLQVERACERIRRLAPHPGWRHGGATAPALVPDVVARKVRGQWTTRLNPGAVPRVCLNQAYAEMFLRCRPRAGAGPQRELAQHLQEARWTVRNVEQRLATILDVAQAIVRRQRHFLEVGAMAMKPLALREIADELGLHESTVSRVTNNKYLATPAGVFELKYFFSRPMTMASGAACSGTAIRGLVKDMLDAEAPDDPLSDAEIARQLARQGLKVARRTVTKYRQQLRIEPVERRRALAALSARR